MALFKCKMCGGALEIDQNDSITTCEYCGTQQTLPKLNDERRTNLYDRANHFRRNNEFDKAMGIYEQILTDDNTDAEAYWSLVLCRYGIEYVEDHPSHKRIPTINRAQYTSIFDDDNYKSALQYADDYQRHIYEEEAKAINEIQKGILFISQKEEPFDVFICYKETDNNGRRTPDSVLANELYHQLTQEGFKVFFSRITLEDKLGSAYEPYIFAALNSAKVMVVLGTRPEYFKAVWVRNEWSRYLSLIKHGQKKMLIPAYKDMDPYDLPDEFSHLQAQDMSKLGFMQDLIRGIKKIIGTDEPKATTIKENVVNNGVANITPLLKRAFIFLEDGEWDSANEYSEKVLDMDPENAEAYLCKLMIELRVNKREDLQNCEKPFDGKGNYQKVIRYADTALKTTMMNYIEHINTRNELTRLETIYGRAQAAMSKATNEREYLEAAYLFKTIQSYKDSGAMETECRAKAEIARLDEIYTRANRINRNASIESQYLEAAQLFETIHEYKDSADRAEKCRENAERTRKDSIYLQADALMSGDSIANYEEAKRLLKSIPGWKDSDELVLTCERRMEEIKAKEEADRLEAEHKAEEERRERERQKELARLEAQRKRKVTVIVSLITGVAIAVFFIVYTVVIPVMNYNNAIALMEEGNYTEAISAFEALDGYKDSSAKINECNIAILNDKYNDAIVLIDSGNIIEAYETLLALNGYKDSVDKANSIYGKYIVEKLKRAKVGNYITFGVYEQDNNTSNGKEEIEWLVLEAKDGKVLIISKYALDCKQFNASNTYITWENCSLRKWLNNDFINVAFSVYEQAILPTVTVSADNYPESGEDLVNETRDQIFLLSIEEANKYFSSSSERECKATDYAVANGVRVDGRNGNCWWWLQAPGYDQNYAASVGSDGLIDELGARITRENVAVRPALWIDLE